MLARRHLFKLMTAACLTATPLFAQDAGNYPARPITLVVPFAPGGATDIAARIFGDRLAKELGGSVVIENRPGAAGNIGLGYVTKAKADGYTLVFSPMGALTTNPHIYEQDFDPMVDLVPISKTFEVDHVLVVNPKLGVTDLKGVIELAKSKPGELTYGSAGIGSSVQMFSVMLDMLAGTEMRMVPYGGSAEARVDVVAGNIDMVMDSIPSAIGQIASGDLLPIAVTNATRNANLPDVPTMVESGMPEFVASAWGGVLAPAGTPQEVIDKLAVASQAAMANEDLIAQYNKNGIQPVSSTPEELAALMVSDTLRWGKIVKEAGIKIE